MMFFFFYCIAELAIKPCRSSRSKLRGEFGIPKHLQNRNKNTTKQQTPQISLSYRPGLSLWQVRPIPSSTLSTPFSLPFIGPARHCGRSRLFPSSSFSTPPSSSLCHCGRSRLSPSIFSTSLLPLTLSYRPGLSLWQVPPFHPPSSLSPFFYPFPLPPIGPACHCGRSRQFLDFTSCS